MVTPLKHAIAGIAVLAVSWAAMTKARSPWDLLALVVGVACVPLWLGLRALGSGTWQWFQGPRRTQAAIATLAGLGLVLFSGRVLLALYGWH